MRLHLVDGTYELFRAHFSPRPGHLDSRGRDRKAIVGLLGSLVSLLQDPEEAPTHVAVAFDRTAPSFRNHLFPHYKTWDGVDPALLEQLGPAEEAVRALGVFTCSLDTHEADDLMATAAARFLDSVEQVRLMTPDKDMLQCLRGDRVVRVDRMRQKVSTETTLKEERGFGPKSVPDFLALVGDTADGIPGLPGFGERGTAALLARFPHLEDIPASPSEWSGIRGAAKLSDTLRARWDDVLLYRRLATLDEAAPFPTALEPLELRGTPRGPFEALCRELATHSLAGRIRHWASTSG